MNVLFSEKQSFRQWWLWLILLPVNSVFIGGLYLQVARGIPFGNNPLSDGVLMILIGLLVLTSILTYFARLETVIKPDGICVRFFPFQLSFSFYSWESLSKSYVRKYNPITEYGGWGLRFGVFKQGRALSVSGNQGLQLVFDDNKKLLIGTNQSQEMREVLERLGQHKE